MGKRIAAKVGGSLCSVIIISGTNTYQGNMNFGTAKADLGKLAKEEREWWVGKSERETARPQCATLMVVATKQRTTKDSSSSPASAKT